MKKETKNQILFFITFLFDLLRWLFLCVVSVISFFMVMKYIKEIFALTYISNIDLIKWMIKIIGFIILCVVSLIYSDNMIMISDKIDSKKYAKLSIVIFIIMTILLIIVGWNFILFLEWVV